MVSLLHKIIEIMIIGYQPYHSRNLIQMSQECNCMDLDGFPI